MTATAWENSVLVDGVEVPLLPSFGDKLTRAIVISLFTWRRAEAGDRLPAGAERMGWWGDAVPGETADRIGSRLWLLRREILSRETVNLARNYAEEALAWMVEDGVCTRIEVAAARVGKAGLSLGVTFWQQDGTVREIAFSDIWRMIDG